MGERSVRLREAASIALAITAVVLAATLDDLGPSLIEVCGSAHHAVA